MKKSIQLVLIALLTFGCFSCGEDKQSIGNESVGTQITESGKKKEVSLIPSVLFYDNTYIYKENSKGELEASLQLFQGQVLYAYPTTDSNQSEIVESKKMPLVNKKPEWEFTKIHYDNTDYWVLTSHIVPNSKPSVIINPTLKYSKPDLEGISETKIPAGIIIAIHNDYANNPESNADYCKVSLRANGKSYRDIFVTKDCVSTFDDDVIAARILFRLNNGKDSIKNPVVLNELAETVKTLSLSDYYKNGILNAF